MKHLSLHTVGSAILLALVSMLVITIYARNPRADRPVLLASRTAEQARQLHLRALAALNDSGWAFEAQSRLDGSGSPDVPRLCTAGAGRVFVYACGQRAEGRLICRKNNRSGETVFRFRCDAPLDTECKLTLSKNSDSAIFSIGGERYAGRVVPMGDS